MNAIVSMFVFVTKSLAEAEEGVEHHHFWACYHKEEAAQAAEEAEAAKSLKQEAEELAKADAEVAAKWHNKMMALKTAKQYSGDCWYGWRHHLWQGRDAEVAAEEAEKLKVAAYQAEEEALRNAEEQAGLLKQAEEAKSAGFALWAGLIAAVIQAGDLAAEQMELEGEAARSDAKGIAAYNRARRKVGAMRGHRAGRKGNTLRSHRM